MKGMQNDLSSWPNVETGGVLLGYASPVLLKILEAIDGGYENVLRKQGRFEYDQQYVTHISNYIANLYQPPLVLLGFWHKHNHSYEPVFSEEDIEIHERLYENSVPFGCSILFQKKPMQSNEYKMRVFIFEKGREYYEAQPSEIRLRKNTCTKS